MDDGTVVRRAEGVAYSELAGGGGGLLLRVETGAYHSVNSVGALIWELLERERTLADLVAAVRERVTGAPPALRDEVADYVEDLRARGLLVT